MSWKVDQVEKYKKGLDDKEKKKWVRIANKVLKEELEKGTNIRAAEIMAIRTANSMFSEINSVGLSFDDMKQHEELRLAEIGDIDEEWQLMIPVGTTYSDLYGEIILTEGLMQDMVDNQHVLKKTRPFLNERHDRGKALAWVQDIRASDDGLEAKLVYNKLGRELIEDEVYKYYSGEILGMSDIDTGEWVYPVFAGVALTNSPVMKSMPEAHLSNDKPNKAQGPKDEGEETMKFSELKEEVLALSDSEKKELGQALGFEDHTADVELLTKKLEASNDVNSQLKEQNKTLGDQVTEFQKAKIEKLLEDVIAEGRMKPADKDKWFERLNGDFATFSEIVAELPKIIDLEGPKGTGQDDDTDVNLSDRRHEFTGKKVKEKNNGSDE